MEISIEEIKKKFEELPEDMRWAIMAAEIDENIIEIGQARGLNVGQMGQLSLETHAVLLGFLAPEQFPASVEASLKLPPEKVQDVVNDVNEKILRGVREKMMSLPKERTMQNEKPVMPSMPPTPSMQPETPKISQPVVQPEVVMPPAQPAAQVVVPEAGKENKDNDILKKAGIEILAQSPDKKAPAPPASGPVPPSTATNRDPYRMPIE